TATSVGPGAVSAGVAKRPRSSVSTVTRCAGSPRENVTNAPTTGSPAGPSIAPCTRSSARAPTAHATGRIAAMRVKRLEIIARDAIAVAAWLLLATHLA